MFQGGDLTYDEWLAESRRADDQERIWAHETMQFKMTLESFKERVIKRDRTLTINQPPKHNSETWSAISTRSVTQMRTK